MLDLRSFAAAFARQWKFSTLAVLAALVSAGIYLWLAPPLYRAQITLQYEPPADQGASVNSVLGGVGLALAGLQGDRLAPARSKAFGVLKSRAFLVPIIKQTGLERYLRPTDWDEESQSWKAAPTEDQLQQSFLSKVLSIDDNTSTGLITLSVTLPQPDQARTLANLLVSSLNSRLMEQAVAESQRNISYLNQQVESAQAAEVRNALAQLLQSEMRRLIIAKGRESYAFTIVDPAFLPARPFSPRPVLVLGLALLGSLALCATWAAVVSLAPSRRH